MCRGPLRSQDLNETPVVSGQTQYSNSLTWTRTFTHPGAALTRVCFTGFDVENYYDTVEIRDGAERIVEVLTGRKNPVGGLASFCSAWLQGDTAKVLFRTDGSVTGTGFVLRRVESRNAFTQDARFPGQWLDRDTQVKSSTTGALLYSGLHQNWHREFDPDTGRYLTPDPLGLAAGSNLFAYAHNDPLHHADPTGLHPLLVPLQHAAQRYGPQTARLLHQFGDRLQLTFHRAWSGILFRWNTVGLRNTSPGFWGDCTKLTDEFISKNLGKGFTDYHWSMNRAVQFNHIWAENKQTQIVVDRVISDFLKDMIPAMKGRTVFTKSMHNMLLELARQKERRILLQQQLQRQLDLKKIQSYENF